MWKWTLVLMCLLFACTAAYCTDYEQIRQDAAALSKSGDKLGAAQLLERAIGQDNSAGAEWLRGYVFLLRSAPKADIVAQFQRVANMPASDYTPDALLRVGYLRDSMKQDPSPDWQRLVRDYPTSKEAGEALHCLGHLALRNDDPDLAISQFQQSAKIEAGDREISGDSALEGGYAFISRYWKTKDARSLTQAISALGPLTRSSVPAARAARAYLGRGEAFLILGLPERALGEYRAALRLESQDPYTQGLAQFEIGYCYCVSQSWTAAVEAFDKFLSAVPGETFVDKDRNWKLARPDYARTVGADPAKANGLTGVELVPSAGVWKAKALLGLKRADEARNLADSIATTFPGLSIAGRLAKLRTECAAAVTEGQ